MVLFDDESCWVVDASVVDGEGDALLIDGDATGAHGMHMGFRMLEDYYGEIYASDGMTTTARIDVASPDLIYGDPSGVTMPFDSWSGWFLADGVAGELGIGELPERSEYLVSTADAAGVQTDHAWIDSGERLDLHSPDVMSGDVGIKRHQDLLISWAPAAFDDNPSIVAIELSVFDTDIDDPNWQTEVVRVVARGDDAVGALTIPSSVLAGLPAAPNNWDGGGDFTGYWGELTVARHRLRKVKVDDGDLVVDFIHAINGPVRLR